jgi:hypothetical protein
MGQTFRIADRDRVNVLNIGLMLLSCGVAIFLPFELFLFAYAILGPAHYLTEISWLQKRHFFTRGKYDFWLLGTLAAMVSFAAPWSSHTAIFTLLALGAALVLMLTGSTLSRLLWFAPVVALALVLMDTTGFATVLLALFVPTLIHVYLFTGFFMIYGALKERSRSGYLAFGVFLLCPLVCWLVHPGSYTPNPHALSYYWNNKFSVLNMTLLGIDLPHTAAQTRTALLQVFSSPAGLIVMRFIAFAYTYHYLNWFSKTSIIRWHEVGAKRLIAITALWLGSIALYLYDFSIGFKFLLYLSLTHVYLEFPLNHISIIGTFRELRGLFGRPVAVAMPAAASGKARRAGALARK